jgi:hypothetical protein
MTSPRDIVYQALDFEGPERVPRELWLLPWAENNHPEWVQKIQLDFPADIVNAKGLLRTPLRTRGQQYEAGEFTDEWGCTFHNPERGYIGQVKAPIVTGDNWEELGKVRLPEEHLDIDRRKVAELVQSTDRFVLATEYIPRPFERLQFIRGTERLMLDLAMRPGGLQDAIRMVHDFDMRCLEAWAETEIDGLMFMDDWGSQTNMLINPKLWAELFLPLYRDYIAVARKHGKKIFMHSDGNIQKILPRLVEMGVDALNSQLFCMDFHELARYRGKLTFWGEMDRQHILPYGTLEEVDQAVKKVKDNLWERGGCIAQCEFGPGARPQNVYRVFEAWDRTGR